MEHHKKIVTHGITKTGQVVSYQADDDGDTETGWWVGRLNADNKQRYLARTIGGDDVVIDLATGLMYPADLDAAGCNSDVTLDWSDALIWAEALDFAGFTDWRLPNIKELISIIDYGEQSPALDESFFVNFATEGLWASTTRAAITTQGYNMSLSKGTIGHGDKAGLQNVMAIRDGI